MVNAQRETHTQNSVGHFDIAGPDLGPLKSFYRTLFEWEIAENGPGYATLATPGSGPIGALVEEQAASLTIGIIVPDLERALELAAGQGGAVAMPIMDNGWVKKARITDPAGNLLTLIQG